MAISLAFLFLKGVDGSNSPRFVVQDSRTLTQEQLYDINSLDGRNHGQVANSISLNTVEENSLIANRTVLATLDQGDDRSDVSDYEVQDGDVLSAIASDFGVSVQTLILANNLKNPNSLTPGTHLSIPPIDGTIYKVKKGDTVDGIAKKYKAESERIIAFNKLPLGGDLKIGDEIIIPDGVMPGGATNSSKKDISNLRYLTLPRLDGYFIAPASCVITQGPHIRNGIDCANKVGTPIYAAASGVVNLAKYGKTGYGNYVRITHPNDTETLYAHFSKIYVKTGDSVVQGQQIGEMGSTGRSSGSHVHYEVHAAVNNLLPYKKGASVVAGR